MSSTGAGVVADSLTETLLGTWAPNETPALPRAEPTRARHRRSVPRSLRAIASRPRVMAITVVDQAASSASNFAVAFLVAHYGTAHALGIFAIVATTYTLTQGLVRSLTSDCLLTRHDPSDETLAVYERAGFLSAMVVSLAASLIMLLLSAAFSGELRLLFVILALTFPLMAAQDFGRYIGISRYNPAYAVWLDGAWLFLFLAAYVVLRHEHHVSLPWVWGSYCVSAAVVGLYSARNHLSLRDVRRQVTFWFHSERAVGLRFAGQWLVASSWAYAAIYLFVLIFSVAVIGQFKLAQVVFGLITVMTQGIVTALVAVAARYFQIDVRKSLRFVLLGGLAPAAVMLAWTALVYFAPVAAMTKAFGSAWPDARRLVPLTGLAFSLQALSMAAIAGLRSIRAAKENLRLAIAMVPVLAGCSLIGGAVWGVQAAIGGMCIGFGVYAFTGWILLVHVAHRLIPGGGTDSDETATALADELVAEATLDPAAAGI
jgi:O-antigen/teichoic acid export membrane protein